MRGSEGLLLVALAVPQRAPGESLATGRTHVVESSHARGLDAHMPRDNAYARGMRADATLDFLTAQRAYAQAIDEFREQGRTLWTERASRQQGLSVTLERAPMMLARLPLASGPSGSAAWRLPIALAWHDKLLAVRAFFGETNPSLARRAREMYHQILDQDGDHTAARLGLAALEADVGRSDRSRAELDRVPPARLDEDANALPLARAYAARGDLEAAFRILERVRRRAPTDLRDVALGNAFDALRRDPRFDTLVGSTPLQEGGLPWPSHSRPPGGRR